MTIYYENALFTYYKGKLMIIHQRHYYLNNQAETTDEFILYLTVITKGKL